MNINSAFSSKYLKAADAEDGQVWTITKVKVETVGQGAKAEQKPVIYFKEVDKGMVCNRTNAKMIAQICRSDDTDDWTGKQIKVIATEVEYQGELVQSLRVRTVTTAKASKTAAADAPVSAPSDSEVGF